MKTHLLILTIVLTMVILHGQAQITFQKIYKHNDIIQTASVGNDIKQTIDEGFILTGYMTVGQGNNLNYEDMYLLKTNSYGNIIWSKTYGGTMQDEGISVHQLSDGGFISLGTTHSFGSVCSDVYLVKVGKTGNLLWSKTFGGTGCNQGNSLDITSDNGFIIAGKTNINTTQGDILLIKTDSTGNITWSKTFGTSNYDYVSCVKQISDGGFLIAGTVQYDANNCDICLIKTDRNGNLQWSKSYGGSSPDNCLNVNVTDDNGFIITGKTESYSLGNSDAYLLKTDSVGNITWFKTFGNTGSGYNTQGAFAKQTLDGGFLMTGSLAINIFNTNSFLLKTDRNGTLIWLKYYGGTEINFATSLQQTNDSGTIICGGAEGFSNNFRDIYLIKTNSKGVSGCYDSITSTDTNSIIPLPTILNILQDTVVLSSTNPNTTVSDVGVDSTICLIEGILEITTGYHNFLRVFPNPFSIQTTLQTDLILKDAALIVYNSFGQQVKQIKNISGQTITFHRDNLANGMYFIRLIQNDKILFTDKVVITNN